MTKIEGDLLNFTNFVHRQLRDQGTDCSLSELFDIWLLENADPAAFEDDVAALKEALDDFDNGDRGTPAGVHSAQLRRERDYLRE